MYWVLVILLVWLVGSFGYTIYSMNNGDDFGEKWYDKVTILPVAALMYLVSIFIG